MVSALFIFSYLLHNTLFFQTPYYRALSGIIGTKFAVLLLYYGSKWVKFSCPKCPQTRINADFYLSSVFIVGNSSALNSALSVLLHILSFAGFPIIHNSSYHIRKTANLLSNCCHRRGFVVSIFTLKPFLKDVQF